MLKKSRAWFDRQSGTAQLVLLVLFIFVVRTFGFGLYQVPTCSMETTMLVGERFFADKLTVWFSSIKRGEIISFNSPLDERHKPYPYSKNVVKNLWQRYISGPVNVTKRVIGIPGDHVEGKIEEGKPVVYVNGQKLDEPYLNKYPIVFANTTYQNKYFSFVPDLSWDKQPFYAHSLRPEQLVWNNPNYPILEPGMPREQDIFDVKLAANQYWMMGDNRLGSYDSRDWEPLDGQLIHGRIRFCIFSLDRIAEDYAFYDPRGWWITDMIVHPIAFWSTVRWSRCLKFVR